MGQDGRSDTELMRAFAGGERTAADDLYGRFAPRVYGLGMVMLGNEAQAEDLVQDTFVKVWRTCLSFDARRGSLDTWVLLVARSQAIDSIRRRVVETRVMAGQREPGEASTDKGPE